MAPVIGLMIKPKGTKHEDPHFVHMPVSMFPSPYPAELLNEAIAMQPVLGKIVAGIVRDPKNLIWKVLEEIAEHDDFVKEHVKVSKAFAERKASGLCVQDIHMCVLRTDYMLNWPLDLNVQLKMVEYNTTSVGLCSASSKVKIMQTYVENKYKHDLPYFYDEVCDNK